MFTEFVQQCVRRQRAADSPAWFAPCTVSHEKDDASTSTYGCTLTGQEGDKPVLSGDSIDLSPVFGGCAGCSTCSKVLDTSSDLSRTRAAKIGSKRFFFCTDECWEQWINEKECSTTQRTSNYHNEKVEKRLQKQLRKLQRSFSLPASSMETESEHILNDWSCTTRLSINSKPAESSILPRMVAELQTQPGASKLPPTISFKEV